MWCPTTRVQATAGACSSLLFSSFAKVEMVSSIRRRVLRFGGSQALAAQAQGVGKRYSYTDTINCLYRVGHRQGLKFIAK